MYLNILKKDLKRKKTMNIILLLFIALAAMFVSSSVNNIIAVTGGLDYYFGKAGITDYFAATMSKSLTEDIKTTLDNSDNVESYGIEPVIYLSSGNVFYNGEKTDKISNTSFIMPCDKMQITYFDADNNPIRSVEKGKVLISCGLMKDAGMSVGDKIEIKIGSTKKSFEIAGNFKDAALGSKIMYMIRFMVNPEDYADFSADSDAGLYDGSLCYIKSNDVNALDKELSDIDSGILFMCTKATLKFTYIMNMIVACILLVVSVCLILISFAAMSFTITFTLNEEFREIGVMKAIGINNTKIRGLYIVKYIALSVIGSVIGFFAGIPFGNMMLESISQEMVIGSESSYFVNILCSLGVVAVITLFCFSCTAKIKKYSPIDAVRSGETGERFHKKGILRIGKSRLDTVSFLAANDVLSSPKRYAIIMLAFTLCLSLVIIIANTANTLKSGQLINYLGMVESDVYYSDDVKLMECISADGEKKMVDLLAKTEKELADNDMPAHCSCEILFKVNVGYKDNICKISAFKGYGTTADEYVYIEGSAPQNADEIAITEITADKLGAKIGDLVTIKWHSGEKKYIISALYTSLNNLGEGIRLNENADADFVNTQGAMAAQIDFNDNPNSEEIQKRIEKLKDILNCDKIRTSSEYVSEIIRVSETLDSVKMLVIVISMIIALLVTALIERSFIEKEKGEIAMLKAIGFKTGAVIKRDTIRLMLASVISSVIAVLISTPLTKLVINPIMGMMGATNGVIYEIAPTEVFLLYPIMMIAATTLTAFLTSLYSAKIKAADASNIE